MKILKIRKKSGGWRTVCCPDEELKKTLREMCEDLERRAAAACPEGVLQGFTKGRSPVTNAWAHVGKRYTLSMDLADFFDTIGSEHLAERLTAEEMQMVLLPPGDGTMPRALQGLPTSPAVANLAAANMDWAVLEAIAKAGRTIVYTRYADDLTFSFDDAGCRPWLLTEMARIVSENGFVVAPRKTRYMPASAGLRHVTGVAVGERGIRPTRDAKRRLRSARHRAEKGLWRGESRARGLAEWCRLRLPRAAREWRAAEEWERTMPRLDWNDWQEREL